MRAELELLEILREEIASPTEISYNYDGMCNCVSLMNMRNKITTPERYLLLEMIREMRPTDLDKNAAYYFTTSSVQPRVDLISRFIDKLNS